MLITVRNKLRRLCFYRCLSVHGGGGGVLSQHALQQVSGGGGIPACRAGFQAHTQEGSLGGSVRGGRGMGSPGPHPRGKLRGIRSRPTAKGEVRGIQSRPTAKGEVEGNQPRGVSLVWGVSLVPGGWRPPPQQTATVADGTHPTGMHSCL